MIILHSRPIRYIMMIMRQIFAYRPRSLFLAGCVQTSIIKFVCLLCTVCLVAYSFACSNCENCTRPISINPTSSEADELGLTLGTCLVTRRLELAAVTVPLWFWWMVCFECGEISFCFRLFLNRTHEAYGMYQAALPHLPLY